MPIRFHHQNGKSPEPYHQQAKVLYLADKVASVYHGTQSVEKVCCIKQSLSHDPTLNEEDIDAAIDDIGQKSLEILSFFDIDPGSMKPYSQLLQEANEELGKLNLSYEQLVMELKQAKEKAENLAYDLKSANERLRKMAMRDGLTGLYNHSYFQDIMVKEISKAKRYKRPFSLILLDLDYFKKINDNYGHPVGDEVLKGISATLIKSLRNADTVARYGGEEFAIVLPETHLKQAVLLAERLRKTIEKQEYKCSDHQIRTTVSVGVSTFSPAHGLNDPKSIITSADQALYLSKNKGRNRISINIPNAQ
jgi:diguanylate cyclase (GGDEF)-like protein